MNWFPSLGRSGNDPPNFQGKIVVIYSNSREGGGLFEDVRIVRIGFSNFIVGRKVVREPWLRERAAHVTVWFGINEIRQMYVFDDIDAARRAYELGEE